MTKVSINNWNFFDVKFSYAATIIASRMPSKLGIIAQAGACYFKIQNKGPNGCHLFVSIVGPLQ
jgi:hypothetical protein